MLLYRPTFDGDDALPGSADAALPSMRGLVRSVHRWWSAEGLRIDRRLVALDLLLVVIAYAAALALRFDGQVPPDYWLTLTPVAAGAAACSVLTHLRLGLYGRVWGQAGAPEARRLVVASVTVTAGVTFVAIGLSHPQLPLSVPLDAGAIALLLLGGARFQGRLRGKAGGASTEGEGALVVGPAESARVVVEQLRREPHTRLKVLAVVTDDPGTWGRSLTGVPVVGPIESVEHYAHHGVTEVLLLPGAVPEENRARFVASAEKAGLHVRSLPSLHDSLHRIRPALATREISVENLLGREQVSIDEAAVRSIIEGHRILITGAGGSIGSEIAAQVARLDPAELVLLDHDETHLHDTVAGLKRPARSVLGDIRDEGFVQRLFLSLRPEVVFHAAAHKHVPILESHPTEAVRTNVHGTDALVRAAILAGTERFVAISTDKAVAPKCVMGATKRLSEQLVVHRDGPGRRFCAVRFGNVLGSRGSVVPTFVKQVQAGGPVTVTHPGMTRYFMTTREAVSLVMQAAASADGGEVFLLDMGEPVRITALAERIITLAGLIPGEDIQITFSGLRPGEKLVEELSSDQETVHPTTHPKILRVGTSLVERSLLLAGVAELCRRAWSGDEESTRRLLFEIARMPETLSLEGEVLMLARGTASDELRAAL